MSVQSATLVRHISSAWVRNAFSGLLAAAILVLFFALMP
jgi:hypothetical protein